MKYWSCCQRKTSEFQHFLDQEGCEIGKHKWVDDKGNCELSDIQLHPTGLIVRHFQVKRSSVGMTGTRRHHTSP